MRRRLAQRKQPAQRRCPAMRRRLAQRKRPAQRRCPAMRRGLAMRRRLAQRHSRCRRPLQGCRWRHLGRLRRRRSAAARRRLQAWRLFAFDSSTLSSFALASTPTILSESDEKSYKTKRPVPSLSTDAPPPVVHLPHTSSLSADATSPRLAAWTVRRTLNPLEEFFYAEKPGSRLSESARLGMSPNNWATASPVRLHSDLGNLRRYTKIQGAQAPWIHSFFSSAVLPI